MVYETASDALQGLEQLYNQELPLKPKEFKTFDPELAEAFITGRFSHSNLIHKLRGKLYRESKNATMQTVYQRVNTLIEKKGPEIEETPVPEVKTIPASRVPKKPLENRVSEEPMTPKAVIQTNYEVGVMPDAVRDIWDEWAPKKANAFKQFYFEAKTYLEISDSLGITRENVRDLAGEGMWEVMARVTSPTERDNILKTLNIDPKTRIRPKY